VIRLLALGGLGLGFMAAGLAAVIVLLAQPDLLSHANVATTGVLESLCALTALLLLVSGLACLRHALVGGDWVE
jgi:hypothetical protein